MSNQHKVLVVGPLPEPALALFDARDDVTYEIVTDFSEDNLLEKTTDASGMALRNANISADVIRRAEGLKVISRFGVGYDNVDLDAMNECGVALTVVGEANAVNVAELTLHMMLELAKQGIRHDRAVRGDNWNIKFEMASIELWRKKVLIVGFGRVGKRVAARCRAFEMEVLVSDPYIDQQLIADAGCTPVADVHAVLPEVDYLTLHLPLTDESRGMIGAEALRLMKPTAILINCARGGIVDEAALHDCLSTNGILGAGLDVLAEEPPDPNHPLLSLNNIVFTPHMGGTSQEASLRMGMVCVQNVLDAIDDKLNPDLVINWDELQRG